MTIPADVCIQDIIGKVPDFGTYFYDDPRKVYDNIVAYEQRVREAIREAEVKKNELTSVLVERFMNSNIAKEGVRWDNDYIREVSRSINMMQIYLGDVYDSRKKFESYFTLKYERPSYCNYTFQKTEYCNFLLFNVMADARNYRRLKENTDKRVNFDSALELVQSSPMLSNFIKFHSFIPQYNIARLFKDDDYLYLAMLEQDTNETYMLEIKLSSKEMEKLKCQN